MIRNRLVYIFRKKIHNMSTAKKTLWGIDSMSRMRVWEIEIEDNRYRTISGLEDGSKVTTEWTVCEGKNTGKSNETTAEQQANLEANSLVRDRIEKDGYYENREDAYKGKRYFQPMLAKKWYDLKPNGIERFFKDTVFVQPKLDGVRCIIDKYGMWTRQGKKILSAPHIRKELEPVFQQHPDLILDGELYNHDLNNDFNKIISLVRKSKPTEFDMKESEKYVQYWNYDFPSCEGTFETRNRTLKYLYDKEIAELGHPEYFVYVPTSVCKNPDDVERWLEEFLNQGYEGAILRSNDVYECKRSDHLLKVKKFLDEEFEIVGFEEGKGNMSGMAGNVLVNVNGVIVAAGINATHDELKEIWENRDNYIGKTATIKYFNKTEDGSLRFPKCVQLAREEYE